MMGLDGEQKEDNLMVEGFNTPDSRNIKPCITKISMVLSHMALVFFGKDEVKYICSYNVRKYMGAR